MLGLKVTARKAVLSWRFVGLGPFPPCLFSVEGRLTNTVPIIWMTSRLNVKLEQVKHPPCARRLLEGSTKGLYIMKRHVTVATRKKENT